ncbi:hypothetical protein [Legionella tunisiensis]|uniref:hypothetical protein n=1 Tax=Legionella tunisiensis TaxID=1034944 RepID=UPI0003014526|nr:hypothetical protein [Legionella tunisiensis]
MAKNVLFNFIDRYLAESQASLPNCQSVELDSTKEGRTYYRLELNHNNPASIQYGKTSTCCLTKNQGAT